MDRRRDVLARTAECEGIERDDELARSGRRAFVVEEGRGICGEIRACEPGGEQLDHQGERRAFGVAERQHGAGERRVRIGGGLALDIERPAARDLLALLLGGEDIAARDLR